MGADRKAQEMIAAHAASRWYGDVNLVSEFFEGAARFVMTKEGSDKFPRKYPFVQYKHYAQQRGLAHGKTPEKNNQERENQKENGREPGNEHTRPGAAGHEPP